MARVVYARFAVSFHGLDIPMEDMPRFRQALLDCAAGLHPDVEYDGDVEVELEETAAGGE